ncbi:AmmeMemoRadiSam system protein B [bacterium]|nr:AmmeMemoRadiSam system protein B [bacterium]
MKRRLNAAAAVLLGSLILTGAVFSQIRESSRAGGFYSANASELKASLNQFYQNAKPAEVSATRIQAIWVPHAGHQFSGQIAANGWYSVRGRPYDAVMIIAPSHTTPLRTISVGDFEAYRTPLGTLPVERELTAAILERVKDAAFVPEAHEMEHAIEVQIPFIQTLLPGVPIVPILVGRLDLGECRDLANALCDICKDKQVLFAASSDMSHYPSYEDALTVDGKVLSAIEEFDIMKIDHLTRSLLQENIPGLSTVLCGWPALQTVMRIAHKLKSSQAEVLPYQNSGDVSGERQRVVGYGAAVFHTKAAKSKRGDDMIEEIDFTPEEKTKLFSIARQAITAAVSGGDMPVLTTGEENLLLKRGVFVTLTNKGRLRGCIGNFNPAYPLWDMVARMAVAAATQDYRFSMDPITTPELENLEIKISILSKMHKIDSIDEIEIGTHGIWIRQGSRSGTYLPEVAVEMGWNTTEFLEHCSAEKAGLGPDAWKKGADIYIYSSQVLSEKDI